MNPSANPIQFTFYAIEALLFTEAALVQGDPQADKSTSWIGKEVLPLSGLIARWLPFAGEPALAKVGEGWVLTVICPLGWKHL